jgi:hypothetical protein
MKKFFVIVMILICSFAFTACIDFGEILGNVLKNAVWEYSEDGKAEIELNFAALLDEEGEYVGVNEWDISYVDGEETGSFNMVLYTDRVNQRQKWVYNAGGDTLVYLDLGQTKYYINETDKKYSTSYNSAEFGELVTAGFYTAFCGTVDLGTEEAPKWSFVEKKGEVSITNSDGESESVIEYLYESVETENSTSSTTVLFDFKKQITPAIERMFFEFSSNDEVTQTVTVYITQRVSDTVDDSTFTIPTTADGYSEYADS